MNRLAKNSIAAGLTTLLVTTGLSFSAFGADSTEAQAEASALTATGFADLVDSEVCVATSAGATSGDGTCGTGLSTQGTGTFNQNASTGGNGTSKADAAIESVNIDGLTTIDLSTIPDDLENIDTGTALDEIIGALFNNDAIDDSGDEGGLGGLLGNLFGDGGLGGLTGLEGLTDGQLDFLGDLSPGDSLGEGGSAGLSAVLEALLDPLQENAISPILTALQDAVPVSVQIGGFTSQCSAADGGDAMGSSTIGSVNIVVDFGGENMSIIIPATIESGPNGALVGAVAPQDIVNGILQGVEDSLNASFDGVLGPLADLVDTIQEQLVNRLLDQAGNELLASLGDAIAPILNGTVNKQEIGNDGESIEVTALELNVLSLDGAGDLFGSGGAALGEGFGDGTGASLQLARVSCGPNGTAQVADDNGDDNVADANADANSDADADANADANADGTPAQPVASIADADSAADADVQASLPNAGAPNLLPFFLLGIALLAFGLAVLLNERRRLGLPSSDTIA